MSSKPTKAKDVMCIPRRMHRSPAYRKLTATSIFILMEFMYRRKVAKTGRKGGYEITNNSELIFTYAEAEKKHKIPRSTFCRSISQLVELGFIEIPHPGGGMLKDCSMYGICDRWKDYGKEEFKKKSRQKDTRGLGFKSETWEDQTHRKWKSNSKASINHDTCSSITNDTRNHQMPDTPSINHATHHLALNYHYLHDLAVLEAMQPARYH